MTPQKTNTQAFSKGYRAFLTRIFRTSNPFCPVDQAEQWLDWDAGWACAEEDYLKGNND